MLLLYGTFEKHADLSCHLHYASLKIRSPQYKVLYRHGNTVYLRLNSVTDRYT